MKRIPMEKKLKRVLVQYVHDLTATKKEEPTKLAIAKIKKLIYNNYRRRDKNGIQKSERFRNGVEEMFSKLPLHTMPEEKKTI